MKSLILMGVSGLMLLMSGGSLMGQTAPKPEPIAGVNETTVSELGPQSGLPSKRAKYAQTSGALADAQAKQEERQKRIWMASIGGLVAGTSADAATSWGKKEANPLLKSANGTFGARALGIKASLAGASIMPQILFRNHKEMRKTFIVFNLVQAGIFSGLAFHNIGIPAHK